MDDLVLWPRLSLPRWLPLLLVGLVVLACVALENWTSVSYSECFSNARFEMATLVALMKTRLGEQPLGPDGRLDVYAILRRDHPLAEVQRVCHDQDGRGPTLQEVEAGDYTNFPWQRRRGRFAPDADRPVPIFWERKGSEPPCVVAFSNGGLRWLSEEEAETLFRRDPGQE